MLGRLCAAGCAVVLALASAASAGQMEWTVTNPTDETYEDEPVRLKVELPHGARQGGYVVRAGGEEVPCLIEEIGGKAWLWVAVSLKPGEKLTHTVAPGQPKAVKPRVRVGREGEFHVMDNGRFGIKLPVSKEGGDPPGPIAAVRLPDGKWVGRSFWHTRRRFTRLTTTVIGDGTVFGKVRLRYEYEGLAGVWGERAAFAEVEVEVHAGRAHAVLTEAHEMDADDFWEFEATTGWEGRQALSQIHSGGAGRAPNRALWPKTLVPLGFDLEDLHARYERADPRVGNTLMWLLPRWSQAYEDGWFFAATDGKSAVGALVARAGKWYWPHVNRVEIRAKPSADYAGFRCPTWKGTRYWLLTAAEHDRWADVVTQDERGQVHLAKQPVADYAYRYCFRPLDKILHDYITEWPGEEGVFYPRSINPMNCWRGWIAGSNRFMPSASGKLQQLCAYQVLIDPDMYGRYRLFWSPENPNFYTDFMRRPLGMLGGLRGHPRYEALAASADEVRWEDDYWSITRPSDAGQECPGYYAYAKGIRSFHRETAWPLGDGRRGMHPGGDTHPPYIFEGRVGDDAGARGYRSKDIQGFGVMLRHRPGTPRETCFALKSGPNRMHFHGDQLAFHYCANAVPLAVDHHCSYVVRAGQEHMHNRVAFGTEDMPFANMDGYERTIAFQTSDAVDIAMGQVSSDRLRYVREYPPEDWDREWPQLKLAPELVYRRTVVLVKGEPQDYLVIRDQYAGPPLRAAYCLHVRATDARRDGDAVDFGGGLRLFVASPQNYAYARHDWVHAVGQVEQTAGIRLETSGAAGEYVTVLYPGLPRKVDRMTLKLTGALGLEKYDKRKDATVVEDADLTLLADFDGEKLLEGVGLETDKVFGRQGHLGKATADGDTIGLEVRFNPFSRGEQTAAVYTLKIQRTGDSVTGSFAGRFGGMTRAGAIQGATKRGVYSQFGRYAPCPIPALERIPGGVRVGPDEIVFAGGIDDDEATTYVTVRRDGKTIQKLTGGDINLDRSQGDIGLIVPDAGYPFGQIPDWLIRQRVPKDGYRAPAARKKADK